MHAQIAKIAGLEMQPLVWGPVVRAFGVDRPDWRISIKGSSTSCPRSDCAMILLGLHGVLESGVPASVGPDTPVRPS